MAGNPDFGDFSLSEEHQALRDAVRDLVVDKVAPRAAEVDETGEFPWDVYEALKDARFHAIHIPEEYGGEGGDALAACLVIEEVARGCASSSLIPAVNKLGTMPLIVGGDETLLKTYLPKVASGEAMWALLRVRKPKRNATSPCPRWCARRPMPGTFTYWALTKHLRVSAILRSCSVRCWPMRRVRSNWQSWPRSASGKYNCRRDWPNSVRSLRPWRTMCAIPSTSSRWRWP